MSFFLLFFRDMYLYSTRHHCLYIGLLYGEALGLGRTVGINKWLNTCTMYGPKVLTFSPFLYYLYRAGRGEHLKSTTEANCVQTCGNDLLRGPKPRMACWRVMVRARIDRNSLRDIWQCGNCQIMVRDKITAMHHIISYSGQLSQFLLSQIQHCLK